MFFKGERLVDRNVGYYLNLPYSVEVVPTEDGYFARVRELPGCTARAGNLEELRPKVEQAKRAWIEEALKRGEHVPTTGTPGKDEEDQRYSGRILVRVPKSLRRELIERAALEGVSLNQFILAALARAVASNIRRPG
jgi:antitoxin HicB